MALKTDENVRGLAEKLAAYGGKGTQAWADYEQKAVELLIAFDFMVDAAKEGQEQPKRRMMRPVLVRA